MHAAGSVTRQRTLTLDPGKLRCFLHHKALVFYDSSAESHFVVFIHIPFGRLAFARLGGEKWTQLSSDRRVQNCIYKDGLVCCHTVVTTKIIMDSIHVCYVSARVYCSGSVGLQVWRPEQFISEALDGHHQKATFVNKVGRMVIYKLCTHYQKNVQ